MKKINLVILIILVIGVGFFIFSRNQRNIRAPETENTQGVEFGENTVVYSDSGFTPSSLSVSAGSTVNFVNESALPMWVASNPHPVHTDYSTFDQRTSGDTYSFTFEETGTYNYHNHLAPRFEGIIIVE